MPVILGGLDGDAGADVADRATLSANGGTTGRAGQGNGDTHYWGDDLSDLATTPADCGGGR